MFDPTYLFDKVKIVKFGSELTNSRCYRLYFQISDTYPNHQQRHKPHGKPDRAKRLLTIISLIHSLTIYNDISKCCHKKTRSKCG